MLNYRKRKKESELQEILASLHRAEASAIIASGKGLRNAEHTIQTS